MTSAPGPSLYNQSTLSDEDFVANFVARHDVLDALVRRLRAIAPDDGGLHHVLIGPRGMGKTSLLRRVAIAINRDADLATRYIPLNFREEQYNVLTLGDFWRNCGEALAEWAEATNQDDLAAHLDEALASKAWASDEGSAEQFSVEVSKLNRRAVLLVDNIDLILDALSRDEQWTLRRRLQARSGPIIVGAATHPLRQTTDRDAAFYEFFQPHPLEPLDEPETEKCMRSLARRRGRNGQHVLQVLDKQPERLRTLHTLTGGNPRVLALIYRLLETEESAATMADLEILLDQVTPYYKARIEEYRTAQQRAVIDAIALNWDPITTHTLSEATNIVSTTLSPLLSKLRKDGLIETVDTSGSYSAHQLSERFLNIWYLMRHGTRRTKQRMRWLVGFLTSFYSSSDLARIARHAERDRMNNRWHKDYALAFDEALARSEIGLESIAPGEYGATLDSAADQSSDSGIEDLEILLIEAKRCWTDRDYPQCLAALDEILTRVEGAEDPKLQEEVTRALINKGLVLKRLGDHAEAVATYNTLLARIGEATTPTERRQAVTALINRGTSLGELGDYQAEMAAYDEALARFGDDDHPAVRDVVATTMVNKGVLLARRGDYLAAMTTFDEVVSHFGAAKRLAQRDQTAKAMFNKGMVLERMGQAASATAAYDLVLTRFGKAKEPNIQRHLAKALINKGVMASRSGDHAAAIAAYDLILKRFSDAEAPVLRRQTAMALINKGVALGRSGNREAEIASYDEVLARFGDAEDMRTPVAKSLLNKAAILARNGDYEAAVATYRAILDRFGDAGEIELREQVAISLLNTGRTLVDAGMRPAAIAAYGEVEARFGDAAVTVLQRLVARALVAKGQELGEINEDAAAIEAFDAVLARFWDATEPGLREQVAAAFFGKAHVLDERGDGAGAIAVYDELLTHLGGSTEDRMQEVVVMAQMNKAAILNGDGDCPSAILTYEKILDRLIGATDESLLKLTANVQTRLASLLWDGVGDSARAEALYKAASAKEPILANANLAWLHLLAGRKDEALEARQSLEMMPAYGRSLLDAGIALAWDNFGSATDRLFEVFDGELDTGGMDFADDLERFLRLAAQTGYGERLLAWFESTGFAERFAPIHAAFRAYVRGERTLLDVNLEVRRPAQLIHDRLNRSRDSTQLAAGPSQAGKRKSVKPRKT